MDDVIYIEDEETAGLIFKIGLSTQNINVLHIPDAEPQSLALLKTAEYQSAKAIFFDLWIGGASGVDLAASLRDAGDMRPFFLLTAGENPNSARLKQINLTYLRKPVVDFKKLADTIRAL